MRIDFLVSLRDQVSFQEIIGYQGIDDLTFDFIEYLWRTDL